MDTSDLNLPPTPRGGGGLGISGSQSSFSPPRPMPDLRGSFSPPRRGGRYSGGSADGMSDISNDEYGGRGSGVYNDRFIPSRNASDLAGAFDNMDVIAGSQRGSEGGNINSLNSYNSNGLNATGGANGMGGDLYRNNMSEYNGVARESQGVMNSLLRSELLGPSHAGMGAMEQGAGLGVSGFNRVDTGKSIMGLRKLLRR